MGSRSGLCSKNEYTKSESNSQLRRDSSAAPGNCVQRTNIQNLKAIHNRHPEGHEGHGIVFKERIYKIWKQFTTNLRAWNPVQLLCSKNEYTKSESNSQRRLYLLSLFIDCVQRTNIQNLKAIHNQGINGLRLLTIVFKERIYKIWKQFTTGQHLLPVGHRLCSKNEYTKSESNSQPGRRTDNAQPYCVQRTNIQNLKAIHNPGRLVLRVKLIVFKERIYKIWKQFTTPWSPLGPCGPLCSKNEYTKSESNSQQQDGGVKPPADCVQRTNIQNLKAIHNRWWGTRCRRCIVFKERIYKIWKQFTTPRPRRTSWSSLCSKNEYTKSESNSQRAECARNGRLNCVQRTNIQNLKAIHNGRALHGVAQRIVFKERIYKIWKQFTTGAPEPPEPPGLCSKNEYTKSESNSQQPGQRVDRVRIVFKERIYKIWKQFTTDCCCSHRCERLCSKNEYTKSESNSQRFSW